MEVTVMSRNISLERWRPFGLWDMEYWERQKSWNYYPYEGEENVSPSSWYGKFSTANHPTKLEWHFTLLLEWVLEPLLHGTLTYNTRLRKPSQHCMMTLLVLRQLNCGIFYQRVQLTFHPGIVESFKFALESWTIHYTVSLQGTSNGVYHSS